MNGAQQVKELNDLWKTFAQGHCKEIRIEHPASLLPLRKSQPRSQGSLLPALRSERERETLENAGHVSPRILEITNKRFGGGEVSVRFVSTERRQVSAAMKLCTWPDPERWK